MCLLLWFPGAQGIAPEINVMARGVDNGDWSHAEARMLDYRSMCLLEKATQTALVREEIQEIGVVAASARAETKATGL